MHNVFLENTQGICVLADIALCSRAPGLWQPNAILLDVFRAEAVWFDVSAKNMRGL